MSLAFAAEGIMVSGINASVVSADPTVSVTPVDPSSAFILPDTSNSISTLLVPSPINISEDPSPNKTSPTALLITKLLPSASILPVLVPDVFLNCISVAVSRFIFV